MYSRKMLGWRYRHRDFGIIINWQSWTRCFQKICYGIMWICHGWQSLTFIRRDIRGLHRAKLSSFQKQFYAKLYRLRIVEQKRFVVGGAKYAEDLKRFHQLQDEYLLLVNNDIKSIVELVDFISEQEERIQQIEDRQHEIYQESSSRKRNIKNEAQYREYQIWHVEVQEELDELKQEKKEDKETDTAC